MGYMKKKMGKKLTVEEYEEIEQAILKMDVMPSMRLLWTAGEAVERSNTMAYNCSFTAPTKIKHFGEILYLLTCGCGVGYSVESKFVSQLPVVSHQDNSKKEVFVIPDTREGWADALVVGMKAWYDGHDIDFDISRIRPLGTPLKTMGGRACIVGDTIVYKDRKKERGFNEITVKQLFDIQNKDKRNWFKNIKLRSLDEESGKFYRNNIVAVYDNGDAPVYEMVTKNGYRIKATDNHRFLNESGEYQFLSEFSVGDSIAVNGSIEKKTGECLDCSCYISRRAQRCKHCFDKTQIKEGALDTTARQRKECRSVLRGLCERCGAVDTRLTIHHKDKNPHNNVKENLETLCELCHQQHHAKENTFGDPYSHKYISFDEIISIDYVGVERVYDLEMVAPNHNFIANGFVSHNSGPEPLVDLLKHTRKIILARQGLQLKPIDVHDIITKIGEVIVAGGARRSAQISLSDLGDGEMRNAKVGAFWESNPHRSMANNSAVYEEKPDIKTFMREWMSLMESGTGERGIFVRNGSIPERRRSLLGERTSSLGTNPCGEILLQNKQFCNLSEIVVRPSDTRADLIRKARLASILGTFQSTLTDFGYLGAEWANNTNEERLLGVSLTGQYDNERVRDAKTLRAIRDAAVDTNIEYATRFGIPRSSSVTAVKPSGTVSQLVDASSGIHARYAPYYIRRVRISSTDPLFKLMRDQGVPCFPEVGQMPETATTWVLEFPKRSPDGAVTTEQLSAIDQLEYWRMVKENYTEHNPSCTIHIKDEEWLDVGAWVFKNWGIVGGLSFLPRDSHVYQLAPYQPMTKKEYDQRVKEMPVIDFSKLQEYEQADNTEAPAACEGQLCRID